MKLKFIGALALLSCGQQSGFDPSSAPTLIRTFNSGVITIDGMPIEPNELNSILQTIQHTGGGIWHYGERGDHSFHDNQWRAYAAIIDFNIPISESFQEDFSDEYTPGWPIAPRLGFGDNPPAWCDMHHRALETETILVSYGYVGAESDVIYDEWRRTKAPHAKLFGTGGCVVGPSTYLVQNCPECVRWEEKWRRK